MKKRIITYRQKIDALLCNSDDVVIGGGTDDLQSGIVCADIVVSGAFDSIHYALLYT